MPNLFDIIENNFILYSSYVLTQRAIPSIEDGFKPVQRRIIHTLIESDDNNFHKVASIVGQTMKYHPHGDSSIFEALVNLANKNLLIDMQGNFGNKLSGEGASAPRYIECKISFLAKDILLSCLTKYKYSYDNRNQEPVFYYTKLPILLMLGTEGIAVGMSTKILPHNEIEIIKTMKAFLNKENFQLYPDFFDGGLIDIYNYNDGLGYIKNRAKLELLKDKIIIKQLPYGVNSENLINSILKAIDNKKIKNIKSINDYTAEKTEIEIELLKDSDIKKTEEALYAFSNCQINHYSNPLVLQKNKPIQYNITDLIKYYSNNLLKILKNELENDKEILNNKLEFFILKSEFIKNKIYLKIEKSTNKKELFQIIKYEFKLLNKEISNEVIDKLINIAILRISNYNIKKEDIEIKKMLIKIKIIDKNIKNIIQYSLNYLNKMINNITEYKNKLGLSADRKTKIIKFNDIKKEDLIIRDIQIKYDKENNIIGSKIKADLLLFKASIFDKLLIIFKDNTLKIINIPDKFILQNHLTLFLLKKEEKLEINIFFKIKDKEKNEILCFKKRKLTLKVKDTLLEKKAKILYINDKDKIVKISYKDAKDNLKTKEFDTSIFKNKTILKNIRNIKIK